MIKKIYNSNVEFTKQPKSILAENNDELVILEQVKIYSQKNQFTTQNIVLTPNGGNTRLFYTSNYPITSDTTIIGSIDSPSNGSGNIYRLIYNYFSRVDTQEIGVSIVNLLSVDVPLPQNAYFNFLIK